MSKAMLRSFTHTHTHTHTHIENRLILFLYDGFRKTDFGIHLTANAQDSLNYLLALFKGWFHLWSFCSVKNASCSFTGI